MEARLAGGTVAALQATADTASHPPVAKCILARVLSEGRNTALEVPVPDMLNGRCSLVAVKRWEGGMRFHSKELAGSMADIHQCSW